MFVKFKFLFVIKAIDFKLHQELAPMVKGCFSVIAWITVDCGSRYQQTDILVSLKFFLADDPSGHQHQKLLNTIDLKFDLSIKYFRV